MLVADHSDCWRSSRYNCSVYVVETQLHTLAEVDPLPKKVTTLGISNSIVLQLQPLISDLPEVGSPCTGGEVVRVLALVAVREDLTAVFQSLDVSAERALHEPPPLCLDVGVGQTIEIIARWGQADWQLKDLTGALPESLQRARWPRPHPSARGWAGARTLRGGGASR